MAKRTFRVEENSLQHRFLQSKAKVQVYGGGFANGKTAAACIKALQLSRDYPGSNGLIARATYPKLNDTIRKEFIKWCPKGWIKAFPLSINGSNTCTLKNGTQINFRYISQQGKNEEASTSNLLSATYDWIVVDQIEDPEITHKDFIDLHGRLRGSTPYVGEDIDMPESGPRWFIMTCNPTRNWVYKNIAKPYHEWLKDGKYHDGLLCERDSETGEPLLDDFDAPTTIIEIYEGSTYENRSNLPEDFIRTLESTYTGQMRERFLLGRWAAYEGLVYPSFDEGVHLVSRADILAYKQQLIDTHYRPTWIEGFDYGIASPSCYLIGFADVTGNVILLDGFHEKEKPLVSDIDGKISSLNHIQKLRRKYVPGERMPPILADPSIFKRGASGGGKVVGESVATLLYNGGNGLRCQRGDNSIISGISKVSGYLEKDRRHHNPFNGEAPAPRLYIATELSFVVDEFNSYYWNTDTSGERIDKPVDRNDHAMDTIKYLLSRRPHVAALFKAGNNVVPLMWREKEVTEQPKRHRYG